MILVNPYDKMASDSAPVSLVLHGVRSTEKEIGVGAYGRVFEVDYEGTLCAAKEIHALLLQYAKGNNLQKIKDNFHRECQIWSTLRHPCVVQFLGSVILGVGIDGFNYREYTRNKIIT